MDPINTNYSSSPLLPNQPHVIEGISIKPLLPSASVDKSIPEHFVPFADIPITSITIKK